MKEKGTATSVENNLWEWVMVGFFATICIACWTICWRLNLDWGVYFLSPLLASMAISLVGAIIFGGLCRGGKPRLFAFLGLCAVIALSVQEFRKSWPAIKWGSPRLKSIDGVVLVFENGKREALPLTRLTDAGSQLLRRWIGSRMPLKKVKNCAIPVLMDGHAATNSARLKGCEQYAQKRNYGIWGGGSEDKDLELLDRLRDRLGDDTIYQIVKP